MRIVNRTGPSGSGRARSGLDQVWFRLAEEAVYRMPAETPADRGRRLVDALIVWITPARRLEPAISRRHVARTATGVKMVNTLAPTRPAAAELERPTPTARRLAEASISPNTRRRAYSGALGRLNAWLAGRLRM